MSLADWYQYKADQSERRAKAATIRAERVDYEETQKIWLILAAEAEPDNLRQFGISLN